jgi:predicted transcriptional regulator of viral defense system
MDWVSVIYDEARTNSVLRVDDLSSKYNLAPVVVNQALARQQKRGLVEHVANKIYFNRLAEGGSPRELVNALRIQAFISLETALREYGISTQSPRVITCLTTERPRVFNGHTIRISYRSISPKLYFGFAEKRTRYGRYKIADPEKALLDSIYFALRAGSGPLDESELDFSHVSRTKLLSFVQRFPLSVLKCLTPLLDRCEFAA